MSPSARGRLSAVETNGSTADYSRTTIEPTCRKAVTDRVRSALIPSQLDHFMPNFGGNHEPAVYTRKVEMVNKDFVMNAKLNLCYTGIR
jgi:hypothetical protein